MKKPLSPARKIDKSENYGDACSIAWFFYMRKASEPYMLVPLSLWREMKKELKELREINVILGQDLLSHMGTLKQKKGTK